MRSLELRLPPVAAALLIAAMMWAACRIYPKLAVAIPFGWLVGAVISVSGVAIALAGVAEFRRAQTTVDPTDPSKSRSVVTSGIYSRTRNPMYLGFLLVLIGWAVYLGSLLALLGPVLFIGYMHRFQILPEERILKSRFGTAYEAYLERVRRWI
jgi:protein-S-isoprenylcysteine O-methyltransferase Ste14